MHDPKARSSTEVQTQCIGSVHLFNVSVSDQGGIYQSLYRKEAEVENYSFLVTGTILKAARLPFIECPERGATFPAKTWSGASAHARGPAVPARY